MSELTRQYAETVAQLAAITEQIKELTEEADKLKGFLRGDLEPGAYTVDGRPALSITPTRRFDPTLAVTVVPNELLRLITVETIDGKRAKQILPPALYERCQKESPTATVKLA